MFHPRYQETVVENAEEFFRLLDPIQPIFQSREMIFRGQSNAKWSLIPSLFRKPQVQKIVNQEDGLTILEASVLHDFAKKLGGINLTDYRARELNIELERIISHLRQLKSEERKPHAGWPNPDILEFMALAQHSGLPTRLLDWSYSPYVAAHFAAYSALEDETGNLAVWTYDKRKAYDCRKTVINPGIIPKLAILEPPFWGSNPNAAAQSGCFLFIRTISGAQSMKIEDYTAPDGAFNKIVAPRSEARKILEYCDKYGVSRSKLFRSFEGCADEVNAGWAKWEADILEHLQERDDCVISDA